MTQNQVLLEISKKTCRFLKRGIFSYVEINEVLPVIFYWTALPGGDVANMITVIQIRNSLAQQLSPTRWHYQQLMYLF